MIDGRSKIQWMDLDTQKVSINTIQNMFQEYNYHSIHIDDDISEIRFWSKSPLLITDWYGWTEVKVIRKIRRNNDLIPYIINIGEHQYRFTSDTVIPVYDLDNIKIGFHGELKYKYLSKFIPELKSGDLIKVRKLTDSNGDLIDFIPIDSIEIINEYIPYCYEIITKSGFLNVNNVYLLSGRE